MRGEQKNRRETETSELIKGNKPKQTHIKKSLRQVRMTVIGYSTASAALLLLGVDVSVCLLLSTDLQINLISHCDGL